MADQLLLREIEFYGYHGVPAAEREVGHRFSIDVALELDLAPAGDSDDLRRTVNYGDVARLVEQIGVGPPVKLIETLAARLAAAILERWPEVDAVRIEARKLMPPVPAKVGSAAVRIRRERS